MVYSLSMSYFTLKDNIKMGRIERGYDTDWIDLAQKGQMADQIL
jgi:hypothetical protein